MKRQAWVGVGGEVEMACAESLSSLLKAYGKRPAPLLFRAPKILLIFIPGIVK